MKRLTFNIKPICALTTLLIAGCSANTPHRFPRQNQPTHNFSSLTRLSTLPGGYNRHNPDSERTSAANCLAAPGNTEILFDLGAGDKVVADTESEDFPPEAKTDRTSAAWLPATWRRSWRKTPTSSSQTPPSMQK